MAQIEILQDLVIIFGCSVVVVLVFARLHLPSIVGFLITGVMLGPYALNLVDDVDQVKVLAEVGVVLLLFTIGLEFSLARISGVRTFAATGGGLQVGMTILIAALAAVTFGETLREGIFWGFLLALSSTVIVMKILVDRSELDSPHGRLIVGILIFQDLVVVPMMLLARLLSGSMGGADISILWTLAKSVLLLGGVLGAALWVVPRILLVVVRARNREIFVITVILICMGIAWITSWIGLSLAIGAFIAGLVISESEYSHQALAEIIPFRDSFNSLFFVSVGMLLDWGLVLEHPFLIAGLTLAVLGVKAAVAGGVTLGLGYPVRVAALVGLSLPQVGEFSFVMAQLGQELGLLDPQRYQLFLAISILSMLATPVLIQWAPRFSRRAESIQQIQRWFGKRQVNHLEPQGVGLRDHVIIAGYGFNGRTLARKLRESKIPYLIVDIHADLVRKGRNEDFPIYFGDVTRAEVLRHLQIHHAKVLVLALSDPFALRRTIQVARQTNPDIQIVVRTRYVRDLDELTRLGANEVVPEEFESSLEILSIVMGKLRMPAGQISRVKEEVRREGYEKFSRDYTDPIQAREFLPEEVEVVRHRLHGDSPMVGKTLRETDLRSRTGTLVLAVVRNEKTQPSPEGSFVLEKDDLLVLVGKNEFIHKAILLLDAGIPPGGDTPFVPPLQP